MAMLISELIILQAIKDGGPLVPFIAIAILFVCNGDFPALRVQVLYKVEIRACTHLE